MLSPRDMIVSIKKQFVFVHIYKTAGTSIKRAVRRYAMPMWQEGANVLFKRVGIPQYGPSMQGDHRTIGDLINQIDRKAFDRMFSFAFVRNPWDWECSHYRYICQQDSHKDHREVSSLSGFKDYIRWRCDGRFQLQQDFILHQGEPAVSFIGRFENLESDFRYVCQKIGIRYRLPKLNSTGSEQYRSAYDNDTRDLVSQTYSEDIERFGYSF